MIPPCYLRGPCHVNDEYPAGKVTIMDALVELEAHRAHLRAVAYVPLGSTGEAADALQEASLRVARADTAGVRTAGGWLTTVVGRVCLDMLRARTARREVLLDSAVVEAVSGPAVVGPAA